MRTRFGLLMAVMAAVAALALPAESRQQAAQAGPIRVLFLIGGASHDWEGMSAVLVRILEASGDFRVTLTGDRDYLAPEKVKDFDTLLFFTQGGELSEAQRKGLLGFVKRGGGFVGLHSATATFKTSDDYWELVGGRFTTHSFREFEVKCEDPSHPVTRVFSSFRVTDEDYHHTFKPGVVLQVLATREGDPTMWTRQYGRGRVIINTLGHDARAWNNRVFQTLAFRSVYWAAGREPKPMPAGLFRAEAAKNQGS